MEDIAVETAKSSEEPAAKETIKSRLHQGAEFGSASVDEPLGLRDRQIAKCGELFAAAIEKWIVPITSAHLGQGRENGIEVSFAAMRSTTGRSGPATISAQDDDLDSSAKSQAYPLALLVIRRGLRLRRAQQRQLVASK